MHISSMECNKDEAVRSRIIAEHKFLQHDLTGAKKFALKAQYLFPELEGLPQLIAVLDVHIVAQQKVEGAGANWYGILQTDATANEATIRRQYRKLALILHPDKNKAVGAEGAFKLISEAWRVLSNKEKKAAHDARWIVKTNISSGSPTMKPTNGFRNFTHFSAWCQRSPVDKKNSFWTGCPSCRMQYEFKRVHENKKISCPTCGKFFMATEILTTTARTPNSHQAFRKAGSSCSEKESQSYKDRPVHVGSSFSLRWGNRRYTAAATTRTEAAKSTAEMVHETYEAVKRDRVTAQKEARKKEAMERMEEEREARRNRKQRRKQEEQEKLDRVIACANGSCEKVLGTESMSSGGVELRRADAVSLIPMRGVDGIGHTSPREAVNGRKECGMMGIVERVARFDQVQEPVQCRVSSTFDSTSSCDSSDVFYFSKRLKVDVHRNGIAS